MCKNVLCDIVAYCTFNTCMFKGKIQEEVRNKVKGSNGHGGEEKERHKDERRGQGELRRKQRRRKHEGARAQGNQGENDEESEGLAQ